MSKKKSENEIAEAFQEVEDLRDKGRIREALKDHFPLLVENLNDEEMEDLVNSLFKLTEEV